MNESALCPPQDAVLALLGDPATHGGREVVRMDTHAAAVFLVGDRAYKMKKAVRFPFLDFSTLERRHRACMAELALNRRAAPELYLGLGAVVARHDGSLALAPDGAVPADGTPVEWLVVMRRFGQEGLLDRMAAEGRLTPDLMRALADAVARFHEEAPPRTDAAGAPAMRRIADGVLQRLQAFPDLFPADRVAALGFLLDAHLIRGAALMDRRRDAGYVRHCHGDLHLRNIVLIDGRPVPFDCIEFDEGLAVCDVLYDLAFLLMDLEHRRLRQLANVLFNRYLEQTGDLAGLALLPLFLSVRAGIRAHITAAMAAAADQGEAGQLQAEAEAYLDLALRLARPDPPRLVAIGGLSGTGKTTLARALAPGIGPAPGAVILRTDVLRKHLMGVEEQTPLGPDGYAEPVTRRVYAELSGRAGLVLDSRHAVICDGVFARPGERADVQEIAQAAGVSFTGLWLVADQRTQVARVEGRSGDASDATAEVVRRQAAYDLGDMRWDILSAGGPPEEVAGAARRLVLSSRG